MTDQPPPETGPAPAPEVPGSEPQESEPQVPTLPAAATVVSAAATVVPAAATVVPGPAPAAPAQPDPAAPPPPAAAPSGGGWVAPPPPTSPPPGGWTPPPAVAPVAGAGWADHVQTQTGPGGPTPGWEYAGFWIRAVAYIIDSIILGVVIGFVWVVIITIVGALALFPAVTVTSDGTLSTAEGAALAAGIVAVFVVLGLVTIAATVLYFIVLWVKRGGTFGQTLLGMRVAREADGAPIGWGAAIIRYVMFVVGWAVFYLGVIWVAFEPRKRGWHDIVAGTVVVRRV